MSKKTIELEQHEINLLKFSLVLYGNESNEELEFHKKTQKEDDIFMDGKSSRVLIAEARIGVINDILEKLE
jgi:hypothetical protein